MIDVKVQGSDQLGDVVRALRATGNKDLRTELYRGLQRSAKPLRAKTQAAALARLPKSGGLAARIAKTRISTKVRSGSSPSVSITCRDTAAASTDRGFVKHPVFGNRNAWVSQSVEGGWFTETLQGSAPEVRKELLEALETVADKIRSA